MNQHGLTAIRDTLQNLHYRSGASDEYRRGIVVGLVSGIMAGQAHFTYPTDFDSAWGEVKRQAQHMPGIGLDTLREFSPSTWPIP